MKSKTIVLGLIGSGKSTLYRKLNEEKTATAVEIELPQVCIGNDKLKETIFRLYLEDNDIDTIITHPYFLCKDFRKIIEESGVKINYKFLEIPFDKRLKRIHNRSREINSNCVIFPLDLLQREEKDFYELKRIL